MKTLSRLLILFSLFLSCTIMSCSKDDESSTTTDCGRDLMPFDIDLYNSLPTDSASVVNVRLLETCLIVDFAYSGCERREVSAMAFVDNGPFIPVLNVKIKNEDPLDACLAFFMHSDTFNLQSDGIILQDGMSIRIHESDISLILDVE